MVRVSPGSPSQWIATLSPRPASTCRSTQLYATLSCPPTNHFAKGGRSQSSTRSHSRAQLSRRACVAQKPSRSSAACSYASAVTFACATSSAGGSKRRFSRSRFSSVSLIDRAPLTSVGRLPGTSCRFLRVTNSGCALRLHPPAPTCNLAPRSALLVATRTPATLCHRGGFTGGGAHPAPGPGRRHAGAGGGAGGGRWRTAPSRAAAREEPGGVRGEPAVRGGERRAGGAPVPRGGGPRRYRHRPGTPGRAPGRPRDRPHGPALVEGTGQVLARVHV